MSGWLTSQAAWVVALGALGAVRVWAMVISGDAQLPHLVAALTLLVPLVLAGLFFRRVWPAAVGLAVVVVIELSLSG
ncbi:UNVERIFIED_CONTAM: hypothetical protein K0B97_04555 [Spiribacter pallidus]|uniref:hypothetical protein n=1 Tax=Spiribacter pallidus TaxID=1987936 RepID=UPI00349FF3E8